MKKYILLALVALAVGGGCRNAKEVCVELDFTIVNQIESDIFVAVHEGDWPTATIKPGETKLFFSKVECYTPWKPGDPVPIMAPDIPRAEMQIGSETMSEQIWSRKYWNVDSSVEGRRLYTLTVTEDLLEIIKKQTS